MLNFRLSMLGLYSTRLRRSTPGAPTAPSPSRLNPRRRLGHVLFPRSGLQQAEAGQRPLIPRFGGRQVVLGRSGQVLLDLVSPVFILPRK